MSKEWGITTEEAAAGIKRLYGGCQHPDSEPVVVATGEVVAHVCTTCLDRLPKSWGCPDCEWVEGPRTMSERFSPLVLGAPCSRHA